jgi:hypothetical protein
MLEEVGCAVTGAVYATAQCPVAVGVHFAQVARQTASLNVGAARLSDGNNCVTVRNQSAGHCLSALGRLVKENKSTAHTRARCTEVAQGASNHSPWNWRLSPVNEHPNHGLMHIFAELAGDIQDERLSHALTRWARCRPLRPRKPSMADTSNPTMPPASPCLK